MQAKLIGTWKLQSAVMEDVESGAQTAAWGEHPKGWLILTPAKRWMVIQTAEGRKPTRDEAELTAAFRSMLAYSGKYRVDGDKIFVDVDIGWDESWVGTEQVRIFKLENDILHIEAPPQPYANFGGKIMRGILTWKRDG